MIAEEVDYTKKLDWTLWKNILSKVVPHKKYVYAIIALNITIALFDTLYPILLMYAINTFIEKRDLTQLPVYIGGYVTLYTLQAYLIYLFVYFAGKLEVSVVYDLRKEGFAKLQSLSFSYFDTMPLGFILSRMTYDIQKVGDVLAWGVLDVFWSGFVILFCVINMLLLAPSLAIYILLVLPVLLFTSFYFQKRILNGHRLVRKINSKIIGVINESINGVKTTKTMVREAKNYEEFSEMTDGMQKASIKVARLSAVYIPFVSVLGSVAVYFVLSVGGKSVLNGALSIGVLSVFINYTMNIFEPIKQIAKIVTEMQGAQASAERAFSLLETESDIQDLPEVIEKYGDVFDHKTEQWPIMQGKIDFKDVSFQYKTGEVVLEQFDLSVLAGEKIALVGETGSGKSTIVNLLCRFYEPTDGIICFDDVDYKQYSQSYIQSNLGYVLQSPHLFSGTIKENIKYANPQATEEEVIKAAKLVNAYDFIMKLENGFDTPVGEGGSRLSAGQRQLISFARAILKNPKIFVLDEATASIDTKTEQMIQQAIETVLAGRTSFIIAHRLSTIRFCDRILLIKGGKMIESGTHETLLKQRGYYYELYTNQFKEEEQQKYLMDTTQVTQEQ